MGPSSPFFLAHLSSPVVQKNPSPFLLVMNFRISLPLSSAGRADGSVPSLLDQIELAGRLFPPSFQGNRRTPSPSFFVFLASALIETGHASSHVSPPSPPRATFILFFFFCLPRLLFPPFFLSIPAWPLVSVCQQKARAAISHSPSPFCVGKSAFAFLAGKVGLESSYSLLPFPFPAFRKWT